MPEVVYPSNSTEGKVRTWADVFPIWEVDSNDTDWRFIDTTLYQIAMNNRFGGQKVPALKKQLIENAYKFCDDHLQTVPLDDEVTRAKVFSQLGMTLYYIEKVFENLGGAYREYKTRPDSHTVPTVST